MTFFDPLAYGGLVATRRVNGMVGALPEGHGSEVSLCAAIEELGARPAESFEDPFSTDLKVLEGKLSLIIRELLVTSGDSPCSVADAVLPPGAHNFLVPTHRSASTSHVVATNPPYAGGFDPRDLAERLEQLEKNASIIAKLRAGRAKYQTSDSICISDRTSRTISGVDESDATSVCACGARSSVPWTPRERSLLLSAISRMANSAVNCRSLHGCAADAVADVVQTRSPREVRLYVRQHLIKLMKNTTSTRKSGRFGLYARILDRIATPNV